MPSDPSDTDYGEIGEELDIDAITEAATQVQRRPLDLGFSEVLPRRRQGAGARSGAESLDSDTFQDRSQREAQARAAGATPTLDRLGHTTVRSEHVQGAEMDTRLRIAREGPPSWIWLVLLLATFAVGFGGVMFWVWQGQRADVAEEAAAIEAAQERLRQQEIERQSRMH